MPAIDNPIVGIDLGTTFSAVAVVDNTGTPRLLQSRDGGFRTVPSAVYFDLSGIPVVGEAALNSLQSEPERVVRFFKREMGNPDFVRNIDGTEWTAEGLSGCVLKSLKDLASDSLDTEVSRAVISVPAYFGDAAKTATKAAAETADLEVVSLINEPTAAAIAYGLDKADQDQTVLVYDFGGGTFDVTILRIAGREFTVVATGGDHKLGGYDINKRIVDFLAERFRERNSVDLREDIQSNAALWNHAEQAKISLSGRQSVMVALTHEQTSMRVDLDRDQFNELIADLVDTTKRTTEASLADAGLTWGQIDAVLPVGGSSRIPMVRDMLEALTGRPPARGVNPDEIVACGAALRAHLADVTESSGGSPPPGRPGPAATGIVVRDVAPHSVGVRATDDHGRDINSIIIPRLTEVPCERIRTYSTVADHQSKIELFILQGEDEDPFSPSVEPIGRLAMTDLPARPAGEVFVSVALRYDANGVIEVEATELLEGRAIRAQVLRKVGELDPELLEAMKSQVTRVGEELPLPPADPGAVDSGSGSDEVEADQSDSAESLLEDDDLDDTEPPPMDFDYYELLEISPDADTEEIESALAAQEACWADDADPPGSEDPEIVAHVQRKLRVARTLLLDQVQRAEYDLSGNYRRLDPEERG